MEAAVVNSFVESILAILETYQVGDIKALKPFMKKIETTPFDISGMMTLTGELTGSVAVAFTDECILGIVSNMFGEPMTEMNDEIKDAVGEMVNMMAGQVNTKMTTMGKQIKAAFTRVQMGSNLPVAHIEGCPVLVLPYKSNAGKFSLEVCFDR